MTDADNSTAMRFFEDPIHLVLAPQGALVPRALWRVEEAPIPSVSVTPSTAGGDSVRCRWRRDYSLFYQERLLRNLQSLMDLHRLLRAKYKCEREQRSKEFSSSSPAWATLLMAIQNLDNSIEQWTIAWAVTPFAHPTKPESDMLHPANANYTPASLFRLKEWSFGQWWRNKEIRSAPLTTNVAILRSFVSTILEDDLLAMKHPVFKEDLFVALRQRLEQQVEFLKQWEREHDSQRSDTVHARVLRTLRPFTHYLPILHLFFIKKIDKAPLLRILLLHHRQAIILGNEFLAHLTADGLGAFAEKYRDMLVKLKDQYYAFRNNLAGCGVQTVGYQEHEIDIDETTPLRYRLDMVDTGGCDPLQRSYAKYALMIHTYQRLQFAHLLTTEIPMNDYLRLQFNEYLKVQELYYRSLHHLDLSSPLQTLLNLPLGPQAAAPSTTMSPAAAATKAAGQARSLGSKNV